MSIFPPEIFGIYENKLTTNIKENTPITKMTCKECLKRVFCCPTILCNQNYAAMAEGGELKTTENFSSALEIIGVTTAPTGTDDVPDDVPAPTTVSGFPPESQTTQTTLATPPPRPESQTRPSTLASTPLQPPSPTANVRGNLESTTPSVRRPRSVSPRGSPSWVNVNAAPSIRCGGRWCNPPQHAVRTPNSVASQTRSLSPLGSPDGVEPRSLSYARRGDRKADITPNKRGFEDPGTK